MKVDDCRRRGFTLIELLMVVMVILMLSALLFRLAALVGEKTARAKAVADIENIQNALNEYLAEYGTYPPTSGMRYNFENTNTQSEVYRSASKTDAEMGYGYGLYSYLFERNMSSQLTDYDEDTSRDIAAKRRWANYLKDLETPDRRDPKNFPQTGSLTNYVRGSPQVYTNSYMTIWDPWGLDYQYESKPPFLSYKLWSAGPDRQSGTTDDISNESSNQ